MKTFEASSVINATPEEIWSVLVDASAYPNWDSGVERIEGRIGPGEHMKVFAKVSPGRGVPVTITEFIPGQKMQWTGGMTMGLFTGVRDYTLTPQADGTTRFYTREDFTGALLPVMWRMMPDMEPLYGQFANGLKQRVEASRRLVNR